MALAPTTGSITASTTEGVEVTSTALPVEHIVIKTMKPYPEVKAGVEKLGRLDDNVRALLTKNDIEGLRAALKRIAGEDGLAIHYVALHGDLLALKGERRPLHHLLHRQCAVGGGDDQGQSCVRSLCAATGGRVR